MKLKDRIIKMLGGFTKDEYRFATTQPVNYHVETRRIDTFRYAMLYRLENMDAEGLYADHIKKEVTMNLLKKVADEGYVRISSDIIREDGTCKITGTIDVVRRYHD